MRDTRFALATGVLLVLLTWQVQAGEASDDGESKVNTITICGSIVGADGEPRSNATVTVAGLPEAPRWSSDSEGRFQIELPLTRARGAILLATSSDNMRGYVVLPWQIDDDNPLPPQEIELKSVRVIEVKVVDRQGDPTAGVKTSVVSGYKVMAQGETDSGGAVTVRVPEGMPLQFILADAGSRGVDYVAFRRPGTPASDPYQLSQDYGEPIALELSPTRKLIVRAVDHDGKPVPDATVTPWYVRLPKKGEMANLGSLWLKTTDDKGVAAYDSIPTEHERRLNIWLHKAGFVARERILFDPKSSEDELVATLLPLVSVRGRVVLPDGSPAAGITIRACGRGHEIDGFRGTTTTGEDGTFQIDVNPDEYCLFAAGNEKWASPVVARIVRLGQSVDAVELKLQRATRVFGRMTAGESTEPVADAYVQLYSKAGNEYYKLPEDQRLPNPKDSRTAILPRIVLGGKTDASGRFEFFTGPGDYYLIGQDVPDAPKFKIVGEKEVEVNLRGKQVATGTITGRVVMHDNRDRGVAEVRVFGYPEESSGRNLDATTDKDGRFEDRRKTSVQIVGVFSEDHSLGTIARVERDAEDVLLILAPTTTLRGNLIDEATDKPAATREVGVYVHIGKKGEAFQTGFRRKDMTDEAGRFEITGLVPGRHYMLQLVNERDREGNARSWQKVGEAKPTEAGILDLGVVLLEKSRTVRTIEEQTTAAFAGDAVKRIEQKLADAKLGYQQVLLVVAGSESEPVKQLFGARYDFSQGTGEFRSAFADYTIVGVSPDRLDAVKDYELETPPTDGATFAILSPEQGLIASVDFEEISEDGKLTRKLLREFLTSRRAPLPDARKQYDAALAEALQSDKRVLVQVSGPGCPPCVLLSRYLDGKHDLVAKDYVYLKLDSRMPNGPELIAELRKGREGGIPWMVILVADGQELISGDSEEGNIGYPGSEVGSAHFEKMLRETRRRLTDDELSELLSELR